MKSRQFSRPNSAGTTVPRVFANRAAAGAELARALKRRILKPPVMVLGLPRGGVAVAAPVARALRAALDVIVVRKVGMPGQPELAIGAIAPPGILVREPRVADELTEYDDLHDTAFERAASEERRELERREQLYRRGLPPLDLSGRTAILVDDGLATGSTMLAAIRAARAAKAARVVVAAPVASPHAAALVAAEADETVFLETPPLFAISQWYGEFEQLNDQEVCRLLALARGSPAPETSRRALDIQE
jgi:putative phosphoribosyl transferase